MGGRRSWILHLILDRPRIHHTCSNCHDILIVLAYSVVTTEEGMSSTIYARMDSVALFSDKF